MTKKGILFSALFYTLGSISLSISLILVDTDFLTSTLPIWL